MLTDRKAFLRMMASAAVWPTAKSSPQQTPTPDSEVAQFAARVAEDCGAALRFALCSVGDRLGLFKSMADSHPISAADLARKTTLNPRMVREWLNAMAAANYIEYRPVNPIVDGQFASFRIALNYPAGAGGVQCLISSQTLPQAGANLWLPGVVWISSGVTSTGFSGVATTQVKVPTAITVTATCHGVSRSTTFSAVPRN